MILHTLSAAPGDSVYLDCLRFVGEEDALLLVGSGVYGALKGSASEAALLDCGARLFILSAHAEAAGVRDVSGLFTMLDMAGFVTLTEQYPRQLAWH